MIGSGTVLSTIDSTTFQLEFTKKLLASRPPVVAMIEVTRRCPLTCAHCYNNLPMGDQTARSLELSYEEHCQILDELTDMGCMEIAYTGGEVFARADFLDIYSYAKHKGLLVQIFTNATLITPKIADYLAQLPPYLIEVTMYGKTRETYERLTGVSGSYDKFMRGITLLNERDLPVILKSVAVTINKHEIDDIKTFALENFKMGKEYKYDSFMTPRIDCSKGPLAVRLSPEESVSLQLKDSNALTMWREYVEKSRLRPKLESFTDQELYHCGAGKLALFINPQGYISLCSSSHSDTYDIRQGSLEEGWNTFLYEVRNKKRTRLTKCVKCSLSAGCAMCPAKGELENGHAEKPVAYICQVTHLKAYVADMEVFPHGECESCPGGIYYESLKESAARIRSEQVSRTLQSKYLPVISSPSQLNENMGCQSCH